MFQWNYYHKTNIRLAIKLCTLREQKRMWPTNCEWFLKMRCWAFKNTLVKQNRYSVFLFCGLYGLIYFRETLRACLGESLTSEIGSRVKWRRRLFVKMGLMRTLLCREIWIPVTGPAWPRDPRCTQELISEVRRGTTKTRTRGRKIRRNSQCDPSIKKKKRKDWINQMLSWLMI